MSRYPTADSVCERLRRAQRETEVILTIDNAPTIVQMDESSPPGSPWEARRSIDRYLDEGVWRTVGSGFQRLQRWAEAHWNPEREAVVPEGTLPAPGGWPLLTAQLAAANATKKLIVAAKLYGADEVARYAAEFAAHGMIEVHNIYVLEGPPIDAAKVLDGYCTILPYPEAQGKPDAASHPEDFAVGWPAPDAPDVCALQSRHFERPRTDAGEHCRYVSPLLADGPEPVALLLGLVWGCGFRAFGSWGNVPAPAAAALPYRHMPWERGAWLGSAALPLRGFGQIPWKRPLPVEELRGLATKFSGLPEPIRVRLQRAMKRVRSSTRRIDEEDRIIDMGIALAALFVDEDEQADPATLVPRRAAWHYADSVDERRHTEDMLEFFFDRYAMVARGSGSREPGAHKQARTASILSEADDVLRTSVKFVIAEGWHDDWDRAADRSSFRANPPRTESEIPSAKSDSLSWSVKQLREIDQALEAVWQPIVQQAHLPPPHIGPTCAELSPQLAEQYREQGIPYVVVHPARLYMAHPEWPGEESEPPDERTTFYCARDVERHARQWSETARRRGLVQFTVAVGDDSSIYLPENCDSWPQPLYSSHEVGSDVHLAGGETPTAERAPPRAPPATSGTSRAGTPSVEDDTDPPPAEWPESVADGLEKEWFRLWTAFQHDVNVATNSLLHLLNAVHTTHETERQRLAHAMSTPGGDLRTVEDIGSTVPAYPRSRAYPVLAGEPLFRRTAPGGPMEQFVFKGWVSEVWDMWESHYRTQLTDAARPLPGAIRPRQSVLGDLRHIRNNLLHHGIAKRREAASCKILRWFKEGEQMQIRMRHVFDFLNQMGWLHEGSVFLEERGVLSVWRIDRTPDPDEPQPALISVRPLVDLEHQDPCFRYGASTVFANGVFGGNPMGLEHHETEAQANERARKWMKMTVNEHGDLYVPGLGGVPAAKLYRAHLSGEKIPGPGMWQPRVQFAE